MIKEISVCDEGVELGEFAGVGSDFSEFGKDACRSAVVGRGARPCGVGKDFHGFRVMGRPGVFI